MQHPSLAQFFDWGMILLVMLFLVCIIHFTPGINPWIAGTAFLLLGGYHLYTNHQQTWDLFRSPAIATIHLGISLVLCAFMVWSTTTPQEESAFWAIFLLPILTAAMRMELEPTLLVTVGATMLYFLLIPMDQFPTEELREDLPEFITPALVFFLVAVLVQFLARTMRHQLHKQVALNQSLRESQQSLRNSLHQLAEAKEQLHRQERLAALGEMAAGVAHEIRNPLGIVASSAQLLEDKVAASDSEAEELLHVIGEETHRLNNLLNDFLAFGRPTIPQFQSCQMHTFLRTCLDRFSNLPQTKDIRLALYCQPDLPMVRIDPDLMEQTLLNLILNAAEASSPGDTIEVTCTYSANQLIIGIQDQGTGIPEAIRETIFTPFFTTKSRGSGLGLANAFKYIQAHNGRIDIKDTSPAGTCVRILLPTETAQ
ncbi:ATP-binding protein [Desulfoplanes formicivorans]|uniref:histidine kinase n=1 Tax=Desulfoplanes formicivorans TaxID=1592317 RepID=A0A194AEL7_9BACT|nr:ATP-binding protein [Desulfoplanes formicivorans]GAU08522.1 histidine kinase [Desulfoplanes formicivorans]